LWIHIIKITNSVRLCDSPQSSAMARLVSLSLRPTSGHVTWSARYVTVAASQSFRFLVTSLGERWKRKWGERMLRFLHEKRHL